MDKHINLNKRKFLCVIIVIFVLLTISNTVNARYVINKSASLTISSVPFYFEAEIDPTIVYNEGETATLTVKNNNGTQYNSETTTYEIRLVENDKFTFSINGENAVNNVITKTINGGSKIDESFEIKFSANIKQLSAVESVKFEIVSTNPYAKVVELPMTVTLKQTTVTLNANGGTVNPSTIIVNKNETYDNLPTPVWYGHVFNGWYSAADGGTKYETTTKVTTDASTQTLYAQWTSLLLADNAQIGDYVNYGVTYSNVETYESGTGGYIAQASYTGWRVIGFETDSNGDKYVKLVTAGIPLSYYHPNETGSGVKSVTALTTNFFSTQISSTATTYKFRYCGFSNCSGTVNQNLFKNDYTQTTSAGVPVVRAMNKDDFDEVYYRYTGIATSGNGDMVRETDIGTDLLAIPSQVSGQYAAYYLATYVDFSTTYLWNVRYAGGIIYTKNQHGIRPVVALKTTVMGEKVNNVWQLSVGQ